LALEAVVHGSKHVRIAAGAVPVFLASLLVLRTAAAAAACVRVCGVCVWCVCVCGGGLRGRFCVSICTVVPVKQ
jgi:hypothetical protein